MHKTYGELVSFFIVYIREAHAADGDWPMSYAITEQIKEPTTFPERCALTEHLIEQGKLTVPSLVDGMDNAANDAYSAHPTRAFLVRKDGRLAVAGDEGPWGLKPALDEIDRWLAQLQKTGKEPPME